MKFVIIKISFCFLTFLSQDGIAQGLFQTRLTQSGTESYGTSVVQSTDSNYVACGASNQSGFYTDAVITKLDTMGEVLWAKRYGGVFIDWVWEIINTLDGGFAIAGYTNSFGNGGYDFYLVKTDENGNAEWEKTYGGSDWDLAYALVQLPDSGFVLVGETYSYGSGNQDAYVVRTDKNGDTLWTKTFGTSGDEMFHSVCYAGNGSLVAAGVANNGSTQNTDGYIVKFDTTGALAWEEYKGTAAHDEIRSVKNHSSGHIMTMGYTDVNGVWDMQFMRIDTSSGFTLENFIDPVPNDDKGFDVCENSDNDYYFALTTNSYGNVSDGTLDIHFLQFNSGFGYIYSGTNGLLGVNETVYSIKNTFDDGFVAAGSTSVSGNTVMYIMKYGKLIQSVNQPSNEELATTSLEKINGIEYRIFPNPTNDMLFIQGDSKINKVNLTDLSGRLILSMNLEKNDLILYLGSLNSGFYLIEITFEENYIITNKIFKQ
ncbi:MAG: T9SS type A sorting domain-containing protein [Flavobacteriales bacterium]